MLHASEQNTDVKGNGDNEISIQDQIRSVSQAAAPVLLPMIDQVSGLDESELAGMGMLGDDS